MRTDVSEMIHVSEVASLLQIELAHSGILAQTISHSQGNNRNL